MNSIYTKIANGDYADPYPYPTKPKKVCQHCETNFSKFKNTPKFCSECGEPLIDDYNEKIKSYKEVVNQYRIKSRTLRDLFKNDLLKEYGYDVDNVKAKLLVEKCWEERHSGGFGEVVGMFEYFEEVL